MNKYLILIIGLTFLNDFANSSAIFDADENELKCYECNSIDDNDCESNPNTRTLKVCNKNEDRCISKLIEEKTIRTCGTEDVCNGNDLCQACGTDGCNTINLKKLKEDNDIIGMWQDLPLSCLVCDALDCKGELSKCSKTTDKCVTVFDNNSKQVVHRGCTSPMNVRKCQIDPESCFECKSNGCNNASAPTEFVNCISCTSANQLDCVTLSSEKNFIKKCHKHCMTALYPDKQNTESFSLIRTCLNDKEIPEQEMCLNKKDKRCQACKDDNCNRLDFPVDRIKCYHCSNEEDCKKPELKTCQTYENDGSCLAIYHSQNLQSMGCASEFSKKYIKELYFKNQLFSCRGSKCNSLQNLPKPNECAICNSKTDENCSMNPKNITTKTTCNKVPNSFCYSRVMPDGETERGCWSSLQLNEKYNCTALGNNNCTPCKNDECNKQLYPQNRLECHTCNSLGDPSCVDNPSNLKACRKYSTDDKACITKLTNGVTLRGCKKEVLCDENNRLNCRSCIGTGCNTISSSHMQYVRPNSLGFFQDLPLQCFVCTGEECDDELKYQEKCKETTDLCVTILKNEINGEILRKGCSSDVDKDYDQYCYQNPELCLSCTSNSCNLANSKSKYTDCLYCGFPDVTQCIEIHPNITYPKRKCLGECMTALTLYNDNQAEPTYNLIRTCADDKEQNDKIKCINGDDEACVTCTENNCNKIQFPEDRRKCYECKGLENCKSPKLSLCDSYKKNDDCYYIYDDNNKIQQMGCASSLSNIVFEKLLDLNKISVCNGNECNLLENQPKEQECLLCNSKDNEDCAISPESVKEKIKCAAPNNKCFSKTDKKGNTIRGCHIALGTEKKYCKNDSNEGCKSCNEANCNVMIFPENRRKCYICDSETDKECETNPHIAKVCSLYKSDEICVTKYDQGKTKRGCGEKLKCDSDDPKVCERCDTDICNTIDIKKRNNSNLLASNVLIIIFAFMFSFFLLN